MARGDCDYQAMIVLESLDEIYLSSRYLSSPIRPACLPLMGWLPVLPLEGGCACRRFVSTTNIQCSAGHVLKHH